MARAKNMNLFLLDGTAQGRIKCTLANWTGVAYKIPRTMLNESSGIQLLNQTGVYLLFGESESTGEPLVYVGQAGVRSNGKGVLYRLGEHTVQAKKEWWNIAVAFTTLHDSFGPTEISYLENRFYRLASLAQRFQTQNDNTPNPGNLTEEKESELEEYIEYAKLVIGALGFPVFEPLRQNEPTSEAKVIGGDSSVLYCRRSSSDAKGQRTAEGFVVFEGSRLRPELAPSCPASVAKYRQKYAERISSEYVLLQDTLFSSPSMAASFVTGHSCNGKVEWKTESGTVLGQLEIEESGVSR